MLFHRRPKVARAARPSAHAESLERRSLLSIGDLDPTFGGSGKVTSDFPVSAYDEARALVVQPDGKYVVAGRVGADFFGEDAAFGLARYHPDGRLDPTFGVGGKVMVPFGRDASATSVALAPDGKIVAAGSTSTTIDFDSPGQEDFAVLRLNPDGTPDSTFDHDGRVVVRVADRNAVLPRVVIRADGKVVLVGTASGRGPGIRDYPAIVRLNADGSPDPTLDDDGILLVNATLTNVSDVAVDGEGRLVVVGRSGNHFAAARILQSGALDLGFDGDGISTATILDRSSARTLRLLSDGRIVAIGAAFRSIGPSSTEQDVAVVRFNADGSFDPTFSDDGRTTIGLAERNDLGLSLAIAPDGSIRIGGRSGEAGGDANRLALFRLDAFGAPDPDFDGDGALLGPTFKSEPAAFVFDFNGSLVVAGHVREGTSDRDIAVERYTPSGAADLAFNGTGIVITDFVAMGDDRATAVVVQPDGKTVVAGVLSYDGNGFPGVLKRYNADGTDDTGFGVGGAVAVDGGAALALQPDGKLVAGGTVYNRTTQRLQWVVTRVNADGSPDLSFGASGKAVFNVSAAGSDSLYALVIQPDGRIVAAGAGNNQFAAARLLPGGQLDSSFGSGGKALVQVHQPGPWGGGGSATSLALAPGGAIVLAGPTASDYFPSDTFAVARLRSNGTLDDSFGTGGLSEYSVAGVGDSGDPVKVVALPDGTLLVASTVRHRGETTFWADKDFMLMRLSEDGYVNAYFGGAEDGIVYTDFAGGDDVLQDMVLLDYSVVLVGRATVGGPDNPDSDFAIARYPQFGSLDGAFGTGGKVTTDFAGMPDSAAAAAVTRGGRLVVAGWAVMPGRASDVAVARYVLANAFATGVKVFYNHSAFDGGDAAANAADDLAVAPDKFFLGPTELGNPDGFFYVTSYSRGINGVMIDVANLPPVTAIGAADFSFRSARGPAAGTWGVGPQPLSVTVRRGAGASGSDRVTLIWKDYDPRSTAADQAVANGWLEVTMRATPNTGSTTPVVLRVGNLIGETSDGPKANLLARPRIVDARDVAATRTNQRRGAGRTNAFDFNRDGQVNVADVVLARNNAGRQLPAPPPTAPPAAASAPRKTLRREAYVLPL